MYRVTPSRISSNNQCYPDNKIRDISKIRHSKGAKIG